MQLRSRCQLDDQVGYAVQQNVVPFEGFAFLPDLLADLLVAAEPGRPNRVKDVDRLDRAVLGASLGTGPIQFAQVGRIRIPHSL